jgi:hypothetical protein
MNAADSQDTAPTLADMFETAAAGMPAAAIAALPVTAVTESTVTDASGEPIGCPICLQVSYLHSYTAAARACRLCMANFRVVPA